MSNVLLLTSGIGPAEGAVHSDLKSSGHRVFTYNIAGQWIPRTSGVPLWMRGYRTRLSPMARNWFTRSIEPKNIDRVITSGLEAAAFAARNVDHSFYPLLWRGDLNFSERNQTLTEAFADLTRASDRLLLEDPWEMDKAVSKNSQVSHLNMLYPTPPRRNYLVSDSGRVAVIYSPSEVEQAGEIHQAVETSIGTKVDVELVNINTLYESADLVKGLDLYEALRLRLRDYSFALVLGTGPHHSTLLRALEHDKDKVVVDQTIGMSYLSRQLDLPHRARKLRCVQILKELIETQEGSELNGGDHAPIDIGDDFLRSLESLWEQDFPDWYEELSVVKSNEPLNVFFSVAALQDLTTGARPQRIRNMHDAFSQAYNSLNIFGARPFFKRRMKLAQYLLTQGRSPGIFYGENSTTPMFPGLTDKLAEFLQEFSRAGGRSMWFVRDLHWLESFEKSPWSLKRAAELKSQGLYELQQVGKSVDVLAAPSLASGEGFNNLISKAGGDPHEWFPLPPAVQPQNILDDASLAKCKGVTVLYSGGISEIYGMDIYLSALAELPEDVLIDFVVREAEAETLHTVLKRFDLWHPERTRVLHTTMDLYRSRTERTLGMILLDSEYARFSFPYKTVTMLERGFPVLCYSDMGIADFVTTNHLGVAVERSTEAIHKGLQILIEEGVHGIPAARAEETWANRVKLVAQALRLHGKEKKV